MLGHTVEVVGDGMLCTPAVQGSGEEPQEQSQPVSSEPLIQETLGLSTFAAIMLNNRYHQNLRSLQQTFHVARESLGQPSFYFRLRFVTRSSHWDVSLFLSRGPRPKQQQLLGMFSPRASGRGSRHQAKPHMHI